MTIRIERPVVQTSLAKYLVQQTVETFVSKVVFSLVLIFLPNFSQSFCKINFNDFSAIIFMNNIIFIFKFEFIRALRTEALSFINQSRLVGKGILT